MNGIASLVVIIPLAIILIVFFAMALSVFNLWVRALFAQARVRVIDLIGMKLRRVPPTQVVLTYISAVKAGLNLSTGMLEAHFLAGGSIRNVVRALIAAEKANIEISFQQAAAIDLAGRNIVDAVQTSVNPKVIDCPDPNKTTGGMLDAVAKDGIRLLVKARVTVRTNLERLIREAGVKIPASAPAYATVNIEIVVQATQDATQDVAEETEVEDPFKLARRFRADGGIMNADVIGGEYDFESARQMYGLGKLVKKVTRTVKKIAKSPIGKAALLYAGGTYLGGLKAFGGAGFGKGTFLSNLRSGQGIANLKSYLGGKLFTSATTKPGTASTGLLSKIFSPEGLILGSSIASGLTADQEDEAQLLADNTGIDINEARNQILKAAAGQDDFRARAFKAGGGLMRLGYSEGDLSQSKVYQKWVERYEKNPESPLVTMHENFEKYKTFYESSKNQKAGGGIMRMGYQEGSKEPVAKKTMPLLDMGGMEKDYRETGGFVPIGRMEKADDVPARLSKNEFVFTADAVRNAGDGDVDKGAEVMYNMMKNLEAGGDVSEESQGLEGARKMFQTSQRLEEVL